MDGGTSPTTHSSKCSAPSKSFNGKLRDELLNGEVFNTLKEAQMLIEQWRRHYNRVRSHSSLGYRQPAPEMVPMASSQVGSGAGAAAMAH